MSIEYNIKVAQAYQRTGSDGVKEFASVEVATFKATADGLAKAMDMVLTSEEFKKLEDAYVLAVDVNAPKIFIVGEDGMTEEVPQGV